mgnify:CR=1 FL=1
MLQDKHGLEHRSSPVSSAFLPTSRHRERLGSSRGNHHPNNSSAQQHNNSSNHTNSSRGSTEHSNNSYSLRDWDTCRGSEAGARGVSDRGDNNHRDSRDRGVSECSTGDATPTSEAEGDCDRTDNNSTHPGGAVDLSAAISRMSQPQVRVLRDSLESSYHPPQCQKLKLRLPSIRSSDVYKIIPTLLIGCWGLFYQSEAYYPNVSDFQMDFISC